MTAITVTNTDWAILSAVKTALAEATIDGEAVFASVTTTTGADQARQCQFTSSPAAILRYLTTDEHVTPEQVVRAAASMELILAAKVDSAAGDQSPQLEEILRLINAAKTAIAADAPTQICDWSAAADIAFGRAKIDSAQRAPWVLAVVPVTFTFVFDDRTPSQDTSIPTFDSADLVSRAVRDEPGSPDLRVRAEAMPGTDGLFVQLHGTAGREIVARGLLTAQGATAAEAHHALKTLLLTRQAQADGTTVATYVGTDGTTYANCLLKSYEATDGIRISPAESGYQALAFVEARIDQLTP